MLARPEADRHDTDKVRLRQLEYEHVMNHTGQPEYRLNCPLCLLTYANILDCI